MDRIKSMQAFSAVVSEGSFAAAAEKLNTSSQLVSKYVAQLEDYLGVRLLNRTTRKINLTEVGQQYAANVKQLLEQIAEIEHRVGAMHTETSGQLRISAPVSFAISHLSGMISDFQTDYPQVTVDLQLNDRKVDILHEGFDIALRIGHLKNSSLIGKFIAPVHLKFYAAPSYLKEFGTPQHPKELAEHRRLIYSYSENDGSEIMGYWFKNLDTQSKLPMVSNNGDVLVQAAVAGHGIALQPTFIAQQACNEGKLVSILNEHAPPSMGLYAVYAHRKLLPRKIRAFLDFSEGYFGNPPVWDS
ncbi:MULTISPECIES: LysR family transcriptional regulator [Gammaproteobacteria]|uniref:LysR family transcriptional regulator n=1 Tax=Gammaproteobacteria TaxID=1236 RepID=UPI000DCFEE78|nr:MULTISPECIES: LysR family transcriptional regulator [Gammaproteobacteria]RTE85837.1 LysR family transcriptional regulator [Aliidiomarina sp. B3213]TCZ90162.1 LysR family transcriptional regulator [Lysobacter sp. N42]